MQTYRIDHIHLICPNIEAPDKVLIELCERK